MITINQEIAQDLVSFIQKRPTVPNEVENSIVEKQKNYYISKLLGKQIKPEKLEDLKNNIEKNFFKSLIQPGESVGIICGQCIGEKTTQSSLNNFHTAGLDTGSTSQIDSLQNIINASKIKKKEIRKYFKVTLYLNEKPKNLKDLKLKTNQFLELIKFKDIIEHVEYKNVVNSIPTLYEEHKNFEDNKILILKLNLEKIFNYRITRQQILNVINCNTKFCFPYSVVNKESKTVDLFCSITSKSLNSVPFFEFFSELKETKIIGIEGVDSHVYSQDKFGEWKIDCLCNSISCFFEYYKIYNLTKISCNSIPDMNSFFGILATQKLIEQKCKEIIPDINDCHFKILSMRMTKNGSIEPLTRYTMRSNNSPLSKASFEESFETFIKACKFNEKEKFKSVSSSIICGKKPKLGTYQCDVFLDPTFFM